MISYAHITLSNPNRPDVAPLPAVAVVSDDAFGLALGAQLIERLQLEQSALHEIMEMGEKKIHLMGYYEPIKVTYKDRETTTGGISCASGVVIGRQLADALKLERVTPVAKTRQEQFIPPTIFPHPKKPSDDEVGRIMQLENALDATMLEKLSAYADAEKKKQKKAKKVAGGRDAMTISIGAMSDTIEKIFARLMVTHIEPFYGQQVEWWETPHLLLYEKGDGYPAHADGYNTGEGDGDTKSWVRRYNRDISLLVYLNDNFTGGQLNFPRQKFKIQPKPGLLVAFPSTPEYLHGAEPTESGERLVLVSWAATAGSQRVALKKEPSKSLMQPLREAAQQKDKL